MANNSRTYIQNEKPLKELMDIQNVPEKLLKKNGVSNGKKAILNWTTETIQALKN